MSQFNDLLMPKLGLTMTEGTIVEWGVNPGDSVQIGDLLFVVETEKVATEIAAEAVGVMGEIVVPLGTTVPVGSVVGRWTGPGQRRESEQVEVLQDVQSTSAQYSQTESTAVLRDARIVATPLARRLATEKNVELTNIKGTGPKGRIKASDVRSYSPLSTATALVKPKSTVQELSTSSLMQSMAARMTQAKQVPHFYLFAEAEVSALLSLRTQLNRAYPESKLTLNHFLLAAVARALTALPYQNRIWHENKLMQFERVDIGMAVATDKGLLAPVLKDVGTASLDDIADRSDDLLTRVRAGRATAADMEGGALTISNAGMFNVTYMTPIINPPQSAILGVGSIRQVFRPDDDGQPVLRQEMGLVLAADHRLHDGASALKFLNYVIDVLQAPYCLLRNKTSVEG